VLTEQVAAATAAALARHSHKSVAADALADPVDEGPVDWDA